MSFRDDTVNSLTERWECNELLGVALRGDCYQPSRAEQLRLRPCGERPRGVAGDAAASGPLALEPAGSDPTRLEAESNPPRLAALPYSPGDRLGDLVLAAEQNLGQGRVAVLGTRSPWATTAFPFRIRSSGRCWPRWPKRMQRRWPGGGNWRPSPLPLWRWRFCSIALSHCG